MSAAEIKAAPVVLGKKLKPFTLGHQALLEAVGSSYAAGPKIQHESLEEEYNNLLLAAFICSLDFRSALVAFAHPWLISAHNWYWRWKLGHFDIFEEAAKFKKYLTDNTCEPNYWINEEHESGESGIPWLQFLKAKNQEVLGISERECMDLPYKAALDNWLTKLAAHGAIKFWTAEDRELIRLSKGGG